MDRRKFLIGTGSIAVGGAAVMGSGAFSTAQGDRDMEVSTKNDPSAYLGLIPSSDFASLSGGKLELEFDQLNRDMLTEFNNVFEIQNNGTNNIRVFIDHTDVPDELNFTAYPSEPGCGGVGGTLTGTGGTTDIPPNANVGVVLLPGGNVPVSIVFGAWSGEVDPFNDTVELPIYAVANDSSVYPDSGPANANHGCDPDDNTVPRYG